MQQEHQHAGKTHTESTVSWGTVLEEVQVGLLQALRVQPLLLGLGNQLVDSVLTLCSGRDLGAAPDHDRSTA